MNLVPFMTSTASSPTKALVCLFPCVKVNKANISIIAASTILHVRAETQTIVPEVCLMLLDQMEATVTVSAIY